MIDIKKLDELIEIVPYNEKFLEQFNQEAKALREIFSTQRLLGLEHYGSTAVPGLSAKPIVDILVGLNEFFLSEDEIKGLEALGYEFVGQLHPQVRRYFLRKRGPLNFNLAVVVFDTADWHNHINVRDYLLAHTDEVRQYEKIKQEALNRGMKTLIEYHGFKDEFVKGLNERARDWKAKNR